MREFSKLLLSAVVALGANFNQPVLWEDLADLDISELTTRSTIQRQLCTILQVHALILQSYDLVNWVYVGHFDK